MKHLVRGSIWGALALVYIAFFAVAGWFSYGAFGTTFAVIATNPWVFVELSIMHFVMGDSYETMPLSIMIAIVVISQFVLAFLVGIIYHSADETDVVKRSVL